MSELLEALFHEYRELRYQYEVPKDEALKLMDVYSRVYISEAIRDCFESSNRLPSIPEAIIMASDDLRKELSGFGYLDTNDMCVSISEIAGGLSDIASALKQIKPQ